MPKGPQGQKRPADAIARAVMVARIATGEIEEPSYVSTENNRRGQAGAIARAKSLSPDARKAISKAAAETRWKEEKEMIEKSFDPLSGLLFGRGTTLVNLKLCRGDAPHVTAEELRTETHFALTQVALGMCDTFSDFPEDRNAKRIDVTKIAVA